MDKTDISSKTLKEMEDLLVNIGEKKFRGKQIYTWINRDLVASFSEMTNLPKALREKLDDVYYLPKVTIVEKLISKKDATSKYLFKMEENTIIESVLMKYSHGNSVCISSQAGCRMGCKFCASKVEGFQRNLTAGEMLAQVYNIQKDSTERVDSVVIMGIGEPLDNYEEVLKFIKIINSKEGLNIGQRHITLSTCGLIEKIYDMADENMQITLAVSLHAPNDSIRKEIMPIANAYSINDVLKACKHYSGKTGRRITYEYAFIKDVNDSKENARELASRLKGSLSHVNLIPLNNIKESNYLSSDKERTEIFAKILEASGIDTTVRRKLGEDISAACGQLRRSYETR